ncbi:SMP-30/gluconolactonase/LRE family protein [Geodermatophilus sp. SYSU D01176]
MAAPPFPIRHTATANLPRPTQFLPGAPAAVIDLQTDEGAASTGTTWRYSDARVEEIDFVEIGSETDPLGPGTIPNRTFDVLPHAGPADFDDSGWRVLSPADTQVRLAGGRVCFNWYRLSVTVPERIGDLDPTGYTVVFEVVVDDYAEVWVDGRLPVALGDAGGQVVAGFNAPNRVLLTDDARPGQTFRIAVFGANGPISASPRNYIWLRSATLDLYRPEQARSTEPVHYHVTRAAAALDAILEPGAELERVAGGFEFTEGPVWTADGALLFSSPNTNQIYRWSPRGQVTVFRSHSGYTGADIGRFTQPGSNGLTFDPQGRLTICQHGNRRVLRVEPHGDVTVLADRYQGRQLNSPNDLVYRSDGTLFFTDPPFGLPGGFDDPKKELPFSGVFAVHDGAVHLVADGLQGPNGIALSPDERHLYIGNWDPAAKVVMRYDVAADASLSGGRVFFDMSDAEGEDAVDGIKVDRNGDLYVCGPSGIWILAPDGRHLGTLHLPESPHNLAWGDADGRGLYVTALTSVYRIRTSVAGVRPGTEEDR